MNQELVYTSVPRGLQPGSKGFCTVACTSGMAPNLARVLESLSGYRHIHPPGSAEAQQNPANISYLQITIGGKQFRVLSRVADAGLDYSSRSNKLAHHLTIEQPSLPACGPAALAGRPDTLLSGWQGDPRKLPNRNLADSPQGTGICNYWKSIAGDAGWAGELAASLMQNKSAFVIFNLGTDVLRLFAEAQQLLPESSRWNATFSTYFTKLPTNVDCKWRAVVAGTPEATTAYRAQNAIVINLPALQGAPNDSPYVVAARTGRSLASPPKPAASITPATAAIPLAKIASSTDDAFSLDSNKQLAPSISAADNSTPMLSLAPPSIPKTNREAAHGKSSFSSRALDEQETSGNIAKWIGLGLAVLLVLGAAGGLGYLLSNSGSNSNTQLSSNKNVIAEKRTDSSNKGPKRPKLAQSKPSEPESPEPESPKTKPSLPPPHPQTTIPTPKTAEPINPPSKPAEPKKDHAKETNNSRTKHKTEFIRKENFSLDEYNRKGLDPSPPAQVIAYSKKLLESTDGVEIEIYSPNENLSLEEIDATWQLLDEGEAIATLTCQPKTISEEDKLFETQIKFQWIPNELPQAKLNGYFLDVSNAILIVNSNEISLYNSQQNSSYLSGKSDTERFKKWDVAGIQEHVSLDLKVQINHDGTKLVDCENVDLKPKSKHLKYAVSYNPGKFFPELEPYINDSELGTIAVQLSGLELSCNAHVAKSKKSIFQTLEKEIAILQHNIKIKKVKDDATANDNLQMLKATKNQFSSNMDKLHHELKVMQFSGKIIAVFDCKQRLFEFDVFTFGNYQK